LSEVVEMRKAVIIGAGMVPVGEHWKLSLRDIAVEALLNAMDDAGIDKVDSCLLYTSPSPRDRTRSRMPSSA
jgi:hypothetical protein